MAVWMEIRCDLRTEPKSYNHKCWSDVNAGPHGMAGDTQGEVIEALRNLHVVATEQGWKRIKGEWACPHCATV